MRPTNAAGGLSPRLAVRQARDDEGSARRRGYGRSGVVDPARKHCSACTRRPRVRRLLVDRRGRGCKFRDDNVEFKTGLDSRTLGSHDSALRGTCGFTPARRRARPRRDGLVHDPGHGEARPPRPGFGLGPRDPARRRISTARRADRDASREQRVLVQSPQLLRGRGSIRARLRWTRPRVARTPDTHPTAEDVEAHLDAVSATEPFSVPMSIFDEVLEICARVGVAL